MTADTNDIWVEPWMMKLMVVVICIFLLGLLTARYYSWFGFGGV